MLRGSVLRLARPRVFLSALALILAGCGGEPPTGAIISVDQDSFRSIVVGSKRPVLVEFWSNSCQPCKALEPHLVSMAQKHQGLLVVKINSDQNGRLAEELGVRLVPTLLVYKDGEAIRRKIGATTPDELADLVSTYVTPK